MQGRVLGLKKTLILSISFYLSLLAITVSSTLSIVLMKNYYAWFFFLCLFAGSHLLIKSILFRLDSCCYFGFILLLVGAFGLIVHLMGIMKFASVYYILAFSFASFATYCFYLQRFHLYLFLILLAVDIAWFFYKINFISLYIFIAILGAGVLLFILKYLFKNFLRR